jgi:hypothetical protein
MTSENTVRTEERAIRTTVELGIRIMERVNPGK